MICVRGPLKVANKVWVLVTGRGLRYGPREDDGADCTSLVQSSPVPNCAVAMCRKWFMRLHVVALQPLSSSANAHPVRTANIPSSAQTAPASRVACNLSFSSSEAEGSLRICLTLLRQWRVQAAWGTFGEVVIRVLSRTSTPDSPLLAVARQPGPPRKRH
jgi:hypothetical protein